MSFIRRYAAGCWMFVIPICLVGIGSIALFLLGYRDLAVVVSQLGTVLTVFGCAAYVVFRDSLARWPNDHWFVRFHKLATFNRR